MVVGNDQKKVKMTPAECCSLQRQALSRTSCLVGDPPMSVERLVSSDAEHQQVVVYRVIGEPEAGKNFYATLVEAA